MADAYKAPGGNSAKEVMGEVQRVHRIRITLTSKNVQNLEKGARLPTPTAFILYLWVQYRCIYRA